MGYYNRYDQFDTNGINRVIPKITIDNASSDLAVIFNKSQMRLDNLSYKYYGDPNFAWLIMLANPKYPSLEYLIPDNVVLRIPYPIDDALKRYETNVNAYLKSHQ